MFFFPIYYSIIVCVNDGSNRWDQGGPPHSWKLKLTPHIKAFIYSMIKSQDFCFEPFKRHPLVCQVEYLFYDAAKNKKSTGICIANGMRDWEYSDNNVENNVKC